MFYQEMNVIPSKLQKAFLLRTALLRVGRSPFVKTSFIAVSFSFLSKAVSQDEEQLLIEGCQLAHFLYR